MGARVAGGEGAEAEGLEGGLQSGGARLEQRLGGRAARGARHVGGPAGGPAGLGAGRELADHEQLVAVQAHQGGAAGRRKWRPTPSARAVPPAWTAAIALAGETRFTPACPSGRSARVRQSTANAPSGDSPACACARPGPDRVRGVQQLVHQVALDPLLGRLDGVLLGQLHGQDGGGAAGRELIELGQAGLGGLLAEGDEAGEPARG